MMSSSQSISRVGLSLAVILIGSFIAPLLMHSSTLAIPAIADELALNAETISWFTLLNVLGNACMILPAGKLADIYGRRKIFCIGVILAGMACVLGGGATTAWPLLAGRFLQGIGGAFIFGSSIALVSSIPPEDQKARVMGIYIAICYLGIVAGPLFGGFVIQHLNWRWVFHIPAAMLFVTGTIGFVFLRWERYGDRSTKVKLLDTSLYMVALIMIALAVFRTNEPIGQALLVAGVFCLAGFCWFQSKRRDPLLQVTLFLDNPVYATLALTHFLTYCSIMSVPFTATLFLQFIKGLDAQAAGLILASQALVSSLVAPAGGWLSARFRARKLMLFGTTATCMAMLVLAFISPTMPNWLIVASLAMLGLGVGVAHTQLLSAAMGSVPDRLLGSASATLNGMRTMGGFVGIGLVSYLMGRSIGRQEIEPHVYPALMDVLSHFFIIAAVLTLMALIALAMGVWIRSKKQLEGSARQQ